MMDFDYRGAFFAKLQAAGVSVGLHPRDPNRVMFFPLEAVTEEIKLDYWELKPEVLEWVREGLAAPPKQAFDTKPPKTLEISEIRITGPHVLTPTKEICRHEGAVT